MAYTFEEAKIVVVDSFHAQYFQLFLINPWVLGNEERGNARFDFFEYFWPEDRFISTNCTQGV